MSSFLVVGKHGFISLIKYPLNIINHSIKKVDFKGVDFLINQGELEFI